MRGFARFIHSHAWDHSNNPWDVEEHVNKMPGDDNERYLL